MVFILPCSIFSKSTKDRDTSLSNSHNSTPQQIFTAENSGRASTSAPLNSINENNCEKGWISHLFFVYLYII